MKYFRLKDKSLFQFISAKQLAFKFSQIDTILKDFPARKFILIGDSGESDPEVYAYIAKKYPTQIMAILIRDAGSKQNNPLRYINLYSKLKGLKWQIFKNVKEIQNFSIK